MTFRMSFITFGSLPLISPCSSEITMVGGAVYGIANDIVVSILSDLSNGGLEVELKLEIIEVELEVKELK